MKIFAAIIAALLITLTGCGNDAPESSTGTYSNDNFKATIGADEISVYVKEGTSESLYWQGTWEDGKSSVMSDADREALDSSLFGSGADNKEFTVDDDSLGFEFKAMGNTHDVSLNKE